MRRGGPAPSGRPSPPSPGSDRLAVARRRQAIAIAVREHGSITLTQLVRRFGISPMTARRDLDTLAATGRVARIHGGAVPIERTIRPAGSAKTSAPTSEERAFATAVVRSLADGETLFLDSSRASRCVAEELVGRALAVNVITNALATAALLGREPALVGVVLAGGRYRPQLGAFVGAAAEAVVRRHWADLAVLERVVPRDAGMWLSGEERGDDLRVRQLMIEHADEHVAFTPKRRNPRGDGGFEEWS